MAVGTRIALIAGSGLAPVMARLGGTARPWMPPEDRPPAPGHRMEVTEGLLGGVPALGFGGRLHYYQGYSMAEVVQPVRDAHAWGAEVLLLTNAAGSLRTEIAGGAVTLIRDHINLMPDSPLRGGAEFLDLSAAYDAQLRRSAQQVARELRATAVPEVVYAAVAGPAFETPAEVRMLRMLGADTVGMSTVPEVLMARRLGMRVLAVSVVTNRAGEGATAGSVLEAAGACSTLVGDLLEGVAATLA
ncbi:MAG TPA: purine-nucleoside phosphorylase [Actinomycetota bacterium]|nr:purine-nucleoside phosphorylase [Actinomycetota bacterium]